MCRLARPSRRNEESPRSRVYGREGGRPVRRKGGRMKHLIRHAAIGAIALLMLVGCGAHEHGASSTTPN